MAKIKYILKTRDFTKDFRSSDSAKLALVRYTMGKIYNSSNEYAWDSWYHEIHNAINKSENSYGTILAEIDREAEQNRTY